MTLLLNDNSQSSKRNKLRIFYNKRVKETWLTYQWVIIAFLWVTTFATGYLGYQEYLPLVTSSEGPVTPFNIIYHILQLFVLQAAFIDNVNLNLQVARFLAPTLVALAGLQALFFVFNSQIDNVVLRFTRKHIIICGLGERGLAIAKSFFDLGEKITVIDNDLDNINIKYLKRHGVRVISGDATSSDLLRRIRAQYCSFLFATMNDDGENVEIAVNLYKLVKETRSKLSEKKKQSMLSTISDEYVNCFINISDPQIRNLLKHHAIATDPYDLFDLNFFNIYENSSNLLFREPELTKYLHLIKVENTFLHIIIIGFGQMGQEIYLMSLKLFEFFGKDHLHYSIFDIVADKRMSQFNKRYQNLENLSSFETKNININAAEFLDEVTKSMKNTTTNEETLIFICMDADNIGVSAALSILPVLHDESIPIFVQTNSETGLATILRSKNIFHLTNNPIIPFGIMEEVCNKKILINPNIDYIAKKFHEHYIKHYERTNFDSDSNPNLKDWDFLSEARKDSYRHKVRTLEIILNAFNYRIIPKTKKNTQIIQFSEDELQKLGRIEHSRWLADRILEGWIFAEGGKKNDLKTNPLLVEWSKLSDEAKNWNIDQMRDIPEILDTCNLIIEKAG